MEFLLRRALAQYASFDDDPDRTATAGSSSICVRNLLVKEAFLRTLFATDARVSIESLKIVLGPKTFIVAQGISIDVDFRASRSDAPSDGPTYDQTTLASSVHTHFARDYLRKDASDSDSDGENDGGSRGNGGDFGGATAIASIIDHMINAFSLSLYDINICVRAESREQELRLKLGSLEYNFDMPQAKTTASENVSGISGVLSELGKKAAQFSGLSVCVGECFGDRKFQASSVILDGNGSDLSGSVIVRVKLELGSEQTQYNSPVWDVSLHVETAAVSVLTVGVFEKLKDFSGNIPETRSDTNSAPDSRLPFRIRAEMKSFSCILTDSQDFVSHLSAGQHSVDVLNAGYHNAKFVSLSITNPTFVLEESVESGLSFSSTLASLIVSESQTQILSLTGSDNIPSLTATISTVASYPPTLAISIESIVTVIDSDLIQRLIAFMKAFFSLELTDLDRKSESPASSPAHTSSPPKANFKLNMNRFRCILLSPAFESPHIRHAAVLTIYGLQLSSVHTEPFSLLVDWKRMDAMVEQLDVENGRLYATLWDLAEKSDSSLVSFLDGDATVRFRALEETVYFDLDAEPPNEDGDEGAEYSGWMDVDTGMETRDGNAGPVKAKRESISHAKNAAFLKAKLAITLKLRILSFELEKYNFDIVQTALNHLQLLSASNTEPQDEDKLPEKSSDNPEENVAVILDIDCISLRLFQIDEGLKVPDWEYTFIMNDFTAVANTGNNEVSAVLECRSMSFVDIDGRSILIKSDSLNSDPMVAITLSSANDVDIGVRQHDVSLALSNLRVVHSEESTTYLIRNMSEFFREPPGLAPVPVADAAARISLQLCCVAIDYRPIHRDFRAWVGVEDILLTAVFIPGSPTMGATVQLKNSSVDILKNNQNIGMALDERTLLNEVGVAAYLKACGYANVFNCDEIEFSIRNSKQTEGGDKFELEVTNSLAYVDLCPDSYRLVLEILNYVASGGDTQYAVENGISKDNIPQATVKIHGGPNINILGLGNDLVHRFEKATDAIDNSAFEAFTGPTSQAPVNSGQEHVGTDDSVFHDAVTISDERPERTERVLILDDAPFTIDFDYFALIGTPRQETAYKRLSDSSSSESTPLVHIKVEEFNLTVRLFAGFDFPMPDFPGDDSENDGDEFDEFPDSPNSQASQTLEPRSTSSLIQAHLSKVKVNYKLYPETCTYANELKFSIELAEIVDNVPTSHWRKFLTISKDGGGETANMVSISILRVRPDLETPNVQEVKLKVNITPLRFYVDQDALKFIGQFFMHASISSSESVGSATSTKGKGDDDIFFRELKDGPIPVKIDYKPKEVSLDGLRGGNLLEVFNFVPLEGAEMTLNEVRLNGVNGTSNLVSLIRMQWLKEVTSNQPHRVVKGLTGVKTLANVGAGIADLILLPWQQYKVDGRVLKGLEKGVVSLSKAAALETLSLGTRVAMKTQSLLETVEQRTSTKGSSEQHAKRERGDQPRNIQEGVRQGAQSLARNVNDAVKTVMNAPMHRNQQSQGSSSSAAAVVQAVPSAILKPMIGATEAVSKTLLGLQNSLDPSKQQEIKDKYKS
ncbi:autophagy- protein 2 [Entophlyctis luteolus]|nr:autophagy- protein 2 [Entophlyctis luteolus]